MRNTAVVALASLMLVPFTLAPVYAQERADARQVVVLGYVVDQGTGQRINGAAVEFPDLERHAITDAEGRFTMEDIPRGRHTLRVRQIGYREYEQSIEIIRDQVTLTIALGARPVALEGVTAHGYTFGERLSERRKRATVSTRVIERDRLSLTASSDALQAMLEGNLLSRRRCGGRSMTDVCVLVRGRWIQPTVYIDERPASLGELETYRPRELYAIELYRGGQHVRAYTLWWIETEGRRDRSRLQPVSMW